MAGANYAKVTAVKGENARDATPLGNGDDSGVNEVEACVGILIKQF